MFKRADGKPAGRVHPVRAMMPYVTPTRDESVVYVDQRIEVERTQAWLAEQKARHGMAPTLFHVILCAAARMLAERPQVNRFVMGSRIYERSHIALSFAVKKRFDDEGDLTSVRMEFEPFETLESVSARVREVVRETRAGVSHLEKETGLVTRMPGFLLRLVMRGQRLLDRWNLLPWALLRDDPMYASMSFTHTGSVGLGAVYHHPFNYGTVSLFTSIGAVEPTPIVQPDRTVAVRDTLNIRYAFDERICDGYYLARSLEVLARHVEEPWRLAARGENRTSDVGRRTSVRTP